MHLWLALTLLGVPQGTPPAGIDRVAEERAWQREIVEELLTHDLDALLAAPPDARDARALLRHLELALRAGRRQAAEAVIDQLGALPIDVPTANQTIERLFARREIDLAARLTERIPGAGRGRAGNFIGHWIRANRPAEDIDRWLVERAWTNERLQFRASQKTDGPLVAALVGNLRTGPCTRAAVHELADIVGLASAPVELQWISGWCAPPLATESRDLGLALAQRAPAAAVPLLERAVALPFTSEDRRRLLSVLSIRPPWTAAEWERRFRVSTLVALAEASRASGDPARAQALVEQMSDADRTLVTDMRFAQLAGAIQGTTGERHVERALADAERREQDSRTYWLARARYFAAREERTEAIGAYERALRADAPNGPGLTHALSAYFRYLKSSGDWTGAWRLLRRQLENPAAPAAAEPWIFGALGELLSGDRAIAVDTEWLWETLDSRRSWPPRVSLLLSNLVRRAPEPERPRLVAHLARLGRSGDASRAREAGEALLRADQAELAVPLLEQSLASTPAGRERDSLRSTLGQARYAARQQQLAKELRAGDWRRAEKTWDTILAALRTTDIQHFTPGLVPQMCASLAEAAAGAGDLEDALRFWRITANLDRTEMLSMLSRLGRAGLRTELVAFYEDMRRRDPASWVPAAALAELHR